MSYFLGTYNNGIVLNSGTQNPVTIGHTASVINSFYQGDVVYGSAAAAWTITNYGIVSGAGALESGVHLAAGGTLNNAAATAFISGYTNGVLIGGTVGTVSNLGTIEGTGTSGVGVALGAGGSVNNMTTGLIEGLYDGVHVTGGSGNIANLGTIAGIGTFADGVALFGGGSVINGSSAITSALIQGSGRRGVFVYGGSGTVTNFGTIQNSGGTYVGVYLKSGGNVINNQGALILGGLGGDGVAIGNAGGTVKNDGSISGIFFHASGIVYNTGQIAASKAVEFYSGAGIVFNTGTIVSSPTSGTSIGIDLQAGGFVVNGQSAAAGGLISASGVGIYSTGAATVGNYGVITASSRGIAISGSGTVGNSGSISVSNVGIYIFGSGSVGNAGTIIAGSRGIAITTGGTVSNSGTIRGSTGVYVRADNGSVDLNNTGGITGTSGYGVLLGAAGTVSNFGAIQGGSYGVYDSGLFTISVSNFGVIGGASRFGVMLGIGGAGSEVDNAASASISGGLIGVGADSIDNAGTVSGATGVEGSTIVNSGTIVGTSGAGITLVGGASGRVTNSGTIIGANGTAIVFGGGTDLVVLEPGGALAGALAGFGVPDTIDLAQVQATLPVFSGTTLSGTLTVYNGTAAVESLLMSGQFAGYEFVLSADGQGGVDVNLRKPLGSVLPGTYGYAIIVTGTNTNTTITTSGSIVAPSGDGLVNAVGVVATLTNMGRVLATESGSNGIYLNQGGTVTNSGGYISGAGVGVMIAGGVGTVTNSGTIIGNAGTAVALAGGASRLILSPGAVFTGVVDGGDGTSVLEVTGTAPAGFVGVGAGGLGLVQGAGTVATVTLSSVAHFSALQVDAAATAVGAAGLSFPTLVNDGYIILGAGDSLGLDIATAVSAGSIDLQAGGTLDFRGAVGGQTVIFEPPGGVVAMEHPELFLGTLSGFTGSGDIIDLTGFSPTGATATLDPVSDKLVVTNGTDTVSLQLDTGESYLGISWDARADHNGAGSGTEIVPVCFCRGTLILTDRGEVPVEALSVGDRVATLSGACRPIVWIGFGRDLVTGRNSLARPIVVRAGALADAVPRRDLYLTHGHALYLEGALIPVEHLVNHRSIHWDAAARVVEYYHIELDGHDVVLAEGAPAESYYDAANRARFHNTRPGSRPGSAHPTFAPVLTGGDTVARIWAALRDRAGGRPEPETTGDPDLHLVIDGRRLDPARHGDGVYSFRVERPPAGPLLLRSRSAVPSLTGAGRHDHRRLGVAIRQIILSAAGVTTALDHTAAPLRAGGCHPPEPGHAWTDGELTLSPALFRHLAGEFTLVVHTRNAAMRYPSRSAGTMAKPGPGLPPQLFRRSVMPR